jgi:hypothetical protein
MPRRTKLLACKMAAMRKPSIWLCDLPKGTHTCVWHHSSKELQKWTYKQDIILCSCATKNIPHVCYFKKCQTNSKT